jgi:hypothetical protein
MNRLMRECQLCGCLLKEHEENICDSCHNELMCEEEEWHDRMNDMYTMDKNGFCDGFTKY